MDHPYKGHTIHQMRSKMMLQSPDPTGINYTTIPHSLKEGQRNFNAQRWLSFWQGLRVRRVELPNDREHSQAHRQGEWMRQASMPWGSHFMQTPMDSARLNNPAQSSFVKQKQLGIPDTYKQFYAFMHAMSAAFGNIKGN